jgi:hypothetical protein
LHAIKFGLLYAVLDQHAAIEEGDISRGIALERRVLAAQEPGQEPLEAVLKGKAIELWSDGERFFLIADEEDAARLGEPRGSVYTAAEVRLITRITDAKVVREIHSYKRRFNGGLTGPA